MRMRAGVLIGLVTLMVLVLAGGRDAGVAGAGDVGEKTLLENEHVRVDEYVFPPGFKGDEHEAPVHEFAYVIDGQLSVVTKGKGKTVVFLVPTAQAHNALRTLIYKKEMPAPWKLRDAATKADDKEATFAFDAEGQEPLRLECVRDKGDVITAVRWTRWPKDKK